MLTYSRKEVHKMDMVKLAAHIADFFKDMYQLLWNIKEWAAKAAEGLK